MKTLFLTLLCIAAAAGTAAGQSGAKEKREVYVIPGENPGTDSKREVYTERYGTGRKNVMVTVNKISQAGEYDSKGRLGWRSGHWAGVVLSYNGLIGDLGHLSLPAEAKFMEQSPKSIGVSLNLIDYTLGCSRKVGFVTGLGFEFNNFRFENNIGLKRENGVLVPDYQYEEKGIHLEKSKLVTCYMNIPVLFEVQFGRNNNFFVNGGVIGGWRIGSHTKIKADDPQLKGKYKDHGNLGIRNLHYGYTLNFGYDHLAVSAVYYPQSVFRSGQGPQVRQFNIGLTILL